MQITTVDNKQVIADMSIREAGKLKASLDSLPTLPPSLKPLLDALSGLPIPQMTRGERRHEWGDPLDMDPDIGPA